MAEQIHGIRRVEKVRGKDVEGKVRVRKNLSTSIDAFQSFIQKMTQTTNIPTRLNFTMLFRNIFRMHEQWMQCAKMASTSQHLNAFQPP